MGFGAAARNVGAVKPCIVIRRTAGVNTVTMIAMQGENNQKIFLFFDRKC
jgi:hypothetical protein